MPDSIFKCSPEQILNTPLLNKGIAFTQEERDLLGLNGYLPMHVATLEEQVKRRYQNFLLEKDPIARYTFLFSLQNRNEILFYRLVLEHLSEMVPLIYTPTIGDISLNFSLFYHQQRGLYFSYPLREKIPLMMQSLPKEEVDVIVVTDGERILGLGDVGIGGMAIPQGKCALYTLFGGLHPSRVLPIHLDVGTNAKNLLDDPLYLGWRHERIRGDAYYEFIDQAVHAISKKFPHAVLQWEDFAKPHARTLLHRYQKKICSFNDDIQGTGAVTLASILSAVKALKRSFKEQKIVVLGGGSAGLGISDMILEALKWEGLTEQEALNNFYIVDIKGLLHTGVSEMDLAQQRYARSKEEISTWNIANPEHVSLLDVITHVHPEVLIGVSTQQGAFTEEIIKTMAKHTERPIILPLSNPVSKSEAMPEDLITWTEGRAIIATGSPFAPVEYQGRKYLIGQCNNVSIFPGIGLGASTSKTKEITDEMFIKAAHVLSEHSPMCYDPDAMLFPPLEGLRDVSYAIAVSVFEIACNRGLAPKKTRAEIERLIQERIWFPEYPVYSNASKTAE